MIISYISRGLVLRTKTLAFRSVRLLLSVLRRRTCVAMQHEVLTPTEEHKKRHSVLSVLICFSRGLVLRTKTAAFRFTRLLLSVPRRRTCVATQHEVLTPTEGGTKNDTQF